MNKIWSIFQYAYIIIGVIFFVDAIVNFVNGDTYKGVISLVFAAFITIIFFVKRNFRKKVIKRNNLNK